MDIRETVSNFIKNKAPFLNLSAIERELNIPATTLYKVSIGKIKLPKRHVEPFRGFMFGLRPPVPGTSATDQYDDLAIRRSIKTWVKSKGYSDSAAAGIAPILLDYQKEILK